ncbi:MAG: Tetratricopeptide 1 repeat-containing protein [Fluviicola sp.]|jgi:tetratricopeptide (TPR) repeat protein|uniref:tetratricopeptide repeat protein n=1 Tax=Fluviicola sp. TaxID=1917219 RepID=UPI0026323F60|nr:tetratricopeptide repeat protein [Fluviicola sp.]MDF3026516.1 Tetratricopeptide 1 repeat-containing protein [Fluviicola sp.]
MNYLNITKGALIAGIMMVSSLSFAQKKVETDAALAFQNFEKAQMSGDMVEMKKQLLKAKESIDIAAANPETEKSPKTLFLKGEIYTSMLFLKMLGDAEFNKNVPENAKEVSIKAYKEAYDLSNKYDSDIENSVNTIKQVLYTTGSAAFDAKKYKEAMMTFAVVNDYTNIINQMDTTSIYYAAIAAENDTNWVQAAEYYKKAADANYKPDIIYRSTAMAYIKAGQNDKAVEFLKQAIAKSPKDKHLYFALGTIAMEMKDDQTVLDNLNKAVEIDPAYADAHYNLGVYFSGKGSDLRLKAGDLPPNAKKESDELLAKSLEFYALALEPLERYVALSPKDVVVLNSLVKIARALKNTEKEAKYKQLLDAAKQ